MKLPATRVKLRSLPPSSRHPAASSSRVSYRSSSPLSFSNTQLAEPARKLHVPAMRRRVLRIMRLRLTGPAPRGCARARACVYACTYGCAWMGTLWIFSRNVTRLNLSNYAFQRIMCRLKKKRYVPRTRTALQFRRKKKSITLASCERGSANASRCVFPARLSAHALATSVKALRRKTRGEGDRRARKGR